MRKKYQVLLKGTTQPSKWLMDQFESHDPISTTTEIINILRNDQAAVGLFKAIAGLSKIAEGKGDKAGMIACCDCLTVLSQVRDHIEAINEDWHRELEKPGSSFL